MNKIKKPYSLDKCEECIFMNEDDHCKKYRVHCSAVFICSDFKKRKEELDKLIDKKQY